MKALKKIFQTAKKRIKSKWIMMEPETWIIVGRVAAVIVIGVIALKVWVIVK